MILMNEVRVTVAVARVLREFLDDPGADRYGYELMRATGFPSGKLYPILRRLTDAGVAVAQHEQINPAEEGRPPRTMYRLSPDGAAFARRALEELARELTSRPAPAAPRLAGGAL